MKKSFIATILIALFFLGGRAMAQVPAPATPGQEPKAARPVVRLSFTERMKQYLQRTGATIDEAKSSAEMVVTNYSDPKGGKTTVVIVNDRRKNLLGFYIYNFGNVKSATNKEEIYKYLLSTNDAITIGSFFVDGEDDIGYKYLVSSVQAMAQATFETTYTTMAAVARERKTEIRQLLGASKDEKGPEVKKAAEERPPDRSASPGDAPLGQPTALIQETPAKRDPGVDTAVVSAAMANFRYEPSELSDVILRLQKDTILVLIDRTPSGPWYNVIDVDSSKEGWIHGSVIRISYTNAPKSAPAFQARRVGTNGDPIVEVTNDSYNELNLRLGTKLYTLPANSKKTIRLSSGTYKYYGAAPGIIPSFGNQEFEIGYEYSWRFWIETVTR